MNTYSNYKVGAIYDSSGTTYPPPLSSIFYCGVWTLGIVLDIYWKFAEACYNHLVVSPHFTVPYDNPLMQEGLNFALE